MSTLKKITSLALSTALLWATRASAATSDILPFNISSLPGNNSTTFNTQLSVFINIFLRIAGLIAVAFLIYGGFRYITSGGNEEAAEGAKRVIQNSIIGLIVIILSYVIIAVITNALFGST